MRKNTKRLWIGIIAAGLLGSVYAWLMHHPAQENADAHTVQLVSIDRNDLASVQVSLHDGTSYTVQFQSDSSGTAYTMSGSDSNADYSETLMQSLRDTACSISARSVEENCDNLETYGLSESSQTDSVTVTDTDGTQITLTVGLSNDFGTYCTSDNSSVYLLNTDDADMLTQPQSYYRNLTVLGGYYSLSQELTSLSIDHLSDGTAISIQSRDISNLDSDAISAYSDFVFTEPVSCGVDDDAFTADLLSDLQGGLTAQRIAEDHPSDISQYGFHTRISLATKNMNAVILVGNTADENEIYVMKEGGSTVFVCSAEDYSFLDSDWNDWRSPNLMPCALCELDRVTVNSHTIEITHVPADENKEQDADTETALLDGSEMSYDELQQLFLAITTLHYTRLLDEPQQAQPEISVTLTMSDGSVRSMSFVKGGSREYLASVNDSGYIYGVPQDNVAGILDAVEKAP